MFTKQIWFGALAMALMTGVASAFPIPVYRTVILPSGHVRSVGTAVIPGLSGGDFVYGSFRVGCGSITTGCQADQTHAVLWTSIDSRGIIDLNPAKFFSTSLTGLSSGMQVGYGYQSKPAFLEQSHALAWFGSSNTIFDLNPRGYAGSKAYAIGYYGEIVGVAYIRSFAPLKGNSIKTHAMLWEDQPRMSIDLNPPGYASSEAFADAGGYQAGYAMEIGGSRHAYMWHGSATQGADLNPKGFTSSYITGLEGQTAVGVVQSKLGMHAYIWHNNSTQQGIDLNAAPFSQSAVVAIQSGREVGWGEYL